MVMFLMALIATNTHVSYILESLSKIQLNGCDARHNDGNQEDQDDQECPASMGMFLMDSFTTNTHVSYIFGILRQNVVEWQ